MLIYLVFHRILLDQDPQIDLPSIKITRVDIRFGKLQYFGNEEEPHFSWFLYLIVKIRRSGFWDVHYINFCINLICVAVLDFSHHKVRPYSRSCTSFSVLKQSTRPTVGSYIRVGEIHQSISKESAGEFRWWFMDKQNLNRVI